MLPGSARGISTRYKFQFFPMTAEEIAQCRAESYLTHFGLPEPKGIVKPWPNWVYWVAFPVFGFTMIGLALYIKQRSAN